MTRFEELINKSNRCTQVALGLPQGVMRDIWAQKGRKLEEMAYKLTIEEAEKEVSK